MQEGVTHINFNEKLYKELKKAYNKAREDKKEQFDFKGHAFLTDYAKYLLEYLSTKFGGK